MERPAEIPASVKTRIATNRLGARVIKILAKNRNVNLLFSIFLLCTIAIQPAESEPTELKEFLTSKGCKYRERRPASENNNPYEKITWSGKCIGGYLDGYGTMTALDRKGLLQICTVTYLNGIENGLGHCETPNFEYDGNFVNGERSGFGKLTIPKIIEYTGEFLNNSPTGHGAAKYPSGDYYEGKF